MAGRPRKNSELVSGHRTKDEIYSKSMAEDMAGEFTSLATAPPSWLDDIAKEEYKRVMPSLKKLNITALDRTAVALYANSYSKYLAAAKDVDDYGIFMHEKSRNGRIVTNTTKKNPAITIMTDMSKEIRSFAGSLGMTLDSRMKLVAPDKNNDDNDDPFATKHGDES